MIAEFKAIVRHRNFLVLLGTAMAAGSSVILLLGAARSMNPEQLSGFALVQLIIMTGVMLQRALFLSPALAAQRGHGKAVVPAAWSMQLSIPFAALLGVFLAVIMGIQEGSYLGWFFLSFAAGGVVLIQDTVRFSLLSRGLVHGSAISDGAWLALIGLTVLIPSHLGSAILLTAYWAASGCIAVAIGYLFLMTNRNRRPRVRAITLKQTWKLGKWSGLDAFMSAAANLMPMLMTGLVMGTEHAGTYRVLQSSLGPLNILSTSLITMLGLDSWKFVSADNLNGLRKTVRRALFYMIVFAFCYIALAELIIIVISGLESHELIRIAVIVGIVGIAGAATSPLSAAALALGYQKHGAAVRLIIVVFSLAASVLAGLGYWLPWNDPIGTVTLFAAITGLIGWSISYKRAMRLEQARLSPAPLKGVGRHFAS